MHLSILVVVEFSLILLLFSGQNFYFYNKFQRNGDWEEYS